MLCNKGSHQREKPTHHNEESPPLAATREKACAQQQGPCAAAGTQHSHPPANYNKRKTNFVVSKWWKAKLLLFGSEGQLS